MDTLHLKAFTAVARLGSFTEAAARLHLTQPAISKRIATLEQQLGCRLFDRVNRSIELTPAGRQLLPRAEAILSSVSDTELAIANLSGKVHGRLKVITSHHIGLHHLPRILKAFAQQYPEVQLDLDFMESERAADAIHSADAELAIITLPRSQDASVVCKPLWRDHLSFVVASDHPLAGKINLDLADLSALPAILPDADTSTTQLIGEMFALRELTLQANMTTNYLETIKMMVSIGLGWSALPDTMLDHSLVVLRFPGVDLIRELGFIRHRDRTLSNAAQAFIDILAASGKTSLLAQATPDHR